MWIPHKRIANPCFFLFSELCPLLELWPFEIFEKNLVSRISQKVFKLEARGLTLGQLIGDDE